MEGLSLLQDCVMLNFNEEVMRQCQSFSCGDDDLNSFFMEDSFLYTEEMLGNILLGYKRKAIQDSGFNNFG